MKADSMLNWSSSAITAKVFVPVVFVLIAGIMTTPIQDLGTAMWCFLIVLPLAASAIWMFVNIGDVRPSMDGLSYRRWRRWRPIGSDQIRNVIHVLPCFAAIILPNGEKLYFFLDLETTRHLRALSELADCRTQDTPAHNEKALLRQALLLMAGVAIGIAIRRIPQGTAAGRPNSENGLGHVWQPYFPWFLGASLIYLVALVIMRRLKGKQLYISLVLIGMGAAYFYGLFLPLA